MKSTPKHIRKTDNVKLRKFYVDLENTGSAGLNGINNLTENDSVVIAYTSHSCKLSLERVQDILESKAEITPIKMRCGMKDALDFQLSTLAVVNAERTIDETEHIIVSADHGYDMVCREANSLGISNLKRSDCLIPQDNIKLDQQDYDKGLLHCITVLGIKQRNRRVVIDLLMNSYSKQDFHNGLAQHEDLTTEEAKEIYNLLKFYLNRLLRIELV